MGVTDPEPPLKNSNTSDFGEIWIIYVDLHEKYNGSDLKILGGHIGGLWGGAAPLKIEVHPILVKFGPYM